MCGATTTTGGADGADAVGVGGLTTTAPAGGATATAGRATEVPESGLAAGRATTGPEGGRVAIAGAAGGWTIGGAGRGWGTILRGSERSATEAGVTKRGADGGATDGRAGTAPVAGVAGGRTTTVGGADAGRCGYCAARSASCLRARTAFRTSPGLEMLERSILGRLSCSVRDADDEAGLEPRSKYPRTFSASPASMELEWVLPSASPRFPRASRICLLLTSSSRARSLIRTLLNPPLFVVLPYFG